MKKDDRPPFLVRAISDAELRQLADYYKLVKLVDAKEQKCKYMSWAASTYESLRNFLSYAPTTGQLETVVVPALLQEDGFLGYLMSNGVTDFNKDHDKVQKLAKATAAIIVTKYFDDGAATV